MKLKIKLNSNNAIFHSIIGVGVACSLIGATLVQAKTNNSAFIVKGHVTAVDYSANTVTVSGISGTGNTTGLIGSNVEYSIRGAKFYQQTTQGKVRTTATKAALVGNEVVMHGVKKTGSRYVVASLTANPKSFTIIGKITKNDQTKKELTVDVTQSSYKPKQYVKKTVHITYGTNTKFMSLGKEINSDEVPDGGQQIKVSGNVESGKWKATSVWDSYSGNKL